MSVQSTVSSRRFVPIFTELEVFGADTSRKQYREVGTSATTSAGQLVALLFASVEHTGRIPALRLMFTHQPNASAAIQLLQDWINEDQDALSPTLAQEQADLAESRLSLREW